MLVTCDCVNHKSVPDGVVVSFGSIDLNFSTLTSHLTNGKCMSDCHFVHNHVCLSFIFPVSQLSHNPQHTVLWLQMAEFEERNGNVTKARSILEKARTQNPKTAELW